METRWRLGGSPPTVAAVADGEAQPAIRNHRRQPARYFGKLSGGGMFAVNSCKPTCAAGHITWEPTSFSVSYVGSCKGKRSYRLISIPIRGIRDFTLQDC
jgi:hypothetical protein